MFDLCQKSNLFPKGTEFLFQLLNKGMLASEEVILFGKTSKFLEEILEKFFKNFIYCLNVWE